MRRRTFPMVEQEPGRPVESRKTILICDDEPALRELVRASLDDGYRFAEASDGLVALELAREVEPDAVILDLMLPRLGGLEVLAQLQADAQLSPGSRARDHGLERDPGGRAGGRGGRVRDEAVRPRHVQGRRQGAAEQRHERVALLFLLAAIQDAGRERGPGGARHRRLRRADPGDLRTAGGNEAGGALEGGHRLRADAGEARPGRRDGCSRLRPHREAGPSSSRIALRATGSCQAASTSSRSSLRANRVSGSRRTS